MHQLTHKMAFGPHRWVTPKRDRNYRERKKLFRTIFSKGKDSLGAVLKRYTTKWIWFGVGVLITQGCFIAGKKYITQRKGEESRKWRKSYLPLIFQHLFYLKHSIKESSTSNFVTMKVPGIFLIHVITTILAIIYMNLYSAPLRKYTFLFKTGSDSKSNLN